ncbi:phenylalanyl-tRNA synthetase, beta subunit [Oceaniovalibus guishaninsula JLT2003]|uniref:Phenylalanine--tRNA ligase beta subunit n=1 Tax=Oceaniovalibus guishaninsula JLT2003 TaxID=1231392 RepID=K2HNB4_9RHOB|nr:phenylalanine--tRNA ligase subunit beta [Oceaniovalibus guishaninsula]EKE44354.1 phenylalanyl-tRNA synthetase, beta subunit [Oceaniovalibus guishaninsula JLT2003]
MKFTLSWLRDHLDTAASMDEIAEALTDLGLEVESVTDPAARLHDFTLGYVESAEQHPDADRLRVCQVRTADGMRQIVCGAPNARAGITVVVARPGTYVPGIDTTIQVGTIRGIESHGMMASEREMELSDEHDGIIELPSGEVGQRFTDWLAANDPARVDPVIEIAITPNRPDALGVRGIARDLAARGLGALRPMAVDPVPGAFDSPVGVAIDADTLEDCPHFTGRVIRGVRNGPSPDWMQARLRAIGLRPISALVDITNFLTYDLNRPLHVFDMAKVQGDLRVHRAAGDEALTALDERDYTLAPGMTVISGARGAESIAGIMGGAATGVSDATTDVFVESAFWNPVTIARTGRALKINSDARYRFERGVDPAFTRPGLEAATRLILDICGGEAAAVVEAGAAPDTARDYALDTGRVQSLVGMSIPPETQLQTLRALGFAVDGDRVTPPSWRPDVQGPADLVEEVARIASLTRLVPQPMPRARPGVPAPILTDAQRREATLRRTCAALGYAEAVTYSFIDRDSAALFGGGDDATRLENPISSEMSHLRPSLLAGLLQAVARNQRRGIADIALFEVGAVFSGGEPGDQQMQVGGLLTGRTGPKDVHGDSRPVDPFDVKADAEALLAAIGAPARAQIRRGGEGWWHPGRHGQICLGKSVMATFGELHPRILRAMGVKGSAMAFTISPDAVPQPRNRNAARPALHLPEHQAVERDFAFVVDARTEAATLIAAAQGADKTLIDDVRVFDSFAGGTLGEGRKSLAIAVRLQPRGRTLTDTEIEAVSDRIVGAVEKATGGELRR